MLPMADCIAIANSALLSWISYSVLEAILRNAWPLPPGVHDSRWQAILYASNVVIGSYVAYQMRDWFFDGFTYHVQDEVQPEMQMYIGLGIGTYIHLLFYQIFVAPVLKDRNVMLAHHLLTLLLLACAIGSHLYRWAGPIMLVHDLADPPLHIAKMVNRQAQIATDPKRKGVLQMLADFFFVVFTAVFFYTRLYLYPTKIIYMNYLLRDQGPYDMPAMNFFCGLLVALELMHVYWGYLLLLAIYNKLIKGQLGDTREDGEEEPTAVAEPVTSAKEKDKKNK